VVDAIYVSLLARPFRGTLARSTINDATAPITVRRSRQVQEAPVRIAECSGKYDQDGSRIEGRNREVVDH
jgi:hypothetical protein